MKKTIIACFVLLTQVAVSQDFNKYVPLECSGYIPGDFITLSSEMYENEKKDIVSKDKSYIRKAKDNHFLESSFQLHSLLFSGKVLFNDPLSNYVKKVADKVFASEPGLKDKVQIFILRKPEVNAYARDNGMIFVTTGLLAQLENEAQLAFILCHEFTHYKKKHVISEVVENENIRRSKKSYKHLSTESKIDAMFNFSKEQETEADIDGLEMYLKTNYSLATLDGVFDVLEYDYLPFDDINFDTTFFNVNGFKVPEGLFLNKVRTISERSESEESDKRSTHPSIHKRRKYISDKVKAIKNDNKVLYGFSEAEFKNARKIARYEVVNLYIKNLSYMRAIYSSYMLLKENPESIYLKKSIAKSMYVLAKYKNESKYDNFNFYPYDSIEGQSQQVYHFFEKIKAKDLGVVAVKYLWNLKKQLNNDAEISAMAEDLLASTIKSHEFKKSDFSDKPKEVAVQELKKETAIDTTVKKEESKYDKIKKTQKINKVESEDNYFTYAWVNEMKDPDFVALFEKYEEEAKKEKEAEEKNSSYEARKLARKKKAKEKEYLTKHGYAFGIDKVVFMNPNYFKKDSRRAKQNMHIESEEAQLKFNEMIKEVAPQIGLQYEMVDDIGLGASQVDRFNDYSYLLTWLQERAFHLDSEVKIVNLDKEKVDLMVKKYNTKYFCWSGYVGERQQSQKLGYLVGCFYLFPASPLWLYLAFKPEYQTYNYNFVFDIEKGETIFTQVSSMDYKDSEALQKSQLYDVMYQLKTKPTSTIQSKQDTSK